MSVFRPVANVLGGEVITSSGSGRWVDPDAHELHLDFSRPGRLFRRTVACRHCGVDQDLPLDLSLFELGVRLLLASAFRSLPDTDCLAVSFPVSATNAATPVRVAAGIPPGAWWPFVGQAVNATAAAALAEGLTTFIDGESPGLFARLLPGAAGRIRPDSRLASGPLPGLGDPAEVAARCLDLPRDQRESVAGPLRDFASRGPFVIGVVTP